MNASSLIYCTFTVCIKFVMQHIVATEWWTQHPIMYHCINWLNITIIQEYMQIKEKYSISDDPVAITA